MGYFFFKLMQRLGMLFAILALTAVVLLGWVGYHKITTIISHKVDAPVLKLANYQNPILAQAEKISQNLNDNKRFNQDLSAHIESITTALDSLPDSTLDKVDLKQRVKILVKLKSNDYTQAMQLAYAQSLAKLTQQMVNVSGEKTNINDFIQWHDQAFFQQVKAQKRSNFLKISTLKAEKATGFFVLVVATALLGIFILLVMMLALLRIERNTRQ